MAVKLADQLPDKVKQLMKRFYQAGWEIWLVGGGVRNLLMHQPIANPDFTTNAKPEEIQKLLPESFYDNKFGTVGLKVDEEIYEITTYRTEGGYSDRRRPDQVSWGKSLEEDLPRREFTISAMAVGRQEGEWRLVDLFGGRQDLKDKVVRAVGNPTERFEEDALRLIRAVRIATQLDFKIGTQTLQAIKQLASSITAVSWERIRDELMKILASKQPAEGIKLLDETRLLTCILPEMEAMKNVAQGGHHIYDVWTHSVESLRFCPSSDPLVRLATLVHDMGKPQTLRHQGPRGVTFYGHEVVGTRMARQIADRLRLSRADKDRLVTLVRWHMFSYNPEMTDSAIRRFIRRVGVENINDMMLLRIGDRKGGGSKATSWRLQELQQRIGEQLYEPLSLKDLKVNGRDVMETLKIKPGPKVGQILNQLFEEILEDSSKNQRDYLLARIRELANFSHTTSNGAAVKVEE